MFGKCFGCALVAGSLALVGLTGCSSASADREDACVASGGTIKSERLLYKDGNWMTRDQTGGFKYCQTSDGVIGEVYNKQITRETTSSFFGHTKTEIIHSRECILDGGKAYSSYRKASKHRYHYYIICVKDGEVLRIYKR